MKNNQTVRVGVIGCGWIMRSTYVPALQALADRISVAAVCDLNTDLAAETARLFSRCTAYADAEKMFQEKGLDAVLVLTSEKVNAKMAQMGLRANVPVYLEKPPAINSAQLDELISGEAKSPRKIYTAFNRRHTPLYAGLDFAGKKIRKVSGALKRKDRQVSNFAHTGIHVIDSAQFFARSQFEEWKIEFESQADQAIWTIRGKLTNGADCELEIAPRGDEFAEFLKFETDTEIWELVFPNISAEVKEGEIIVRPHDGSPATVTPGNKALPFFEAMGFRACLEDFLQHLAGAENSIHRLEWCRPTIAIMETMGTRAAAS